MKIGRSAALHPSRTRPGASVVRPRREGIGTCLRNGEPEIDDLPGAWIVRRPLPAEVMTREGDAAREAWTGIWTPETRAIWRRMWIKVARLGISVVESNDRRVASGAHVQPSAGTTEAQPKASAP